MRNTGGFFALPRELRDRIYDYLFRSDTGTLVRFRNDKLRVAATYDITMQMACETRRLHDNRTGIRSMIEAGLPSWVLANKQVFAEALEQFHHKANFMCIYDFPFRLSRSPAPSNHLLLHRARVANLQGCVLPMVRIWKEPDLDGTNSYIFRYQPHIERLYQQTMHSLSNPWSALRILTLGFAINEEFLPPCLDAIPYRFQDEVGFIGKLSKSLMKIELVLSILYSDLLPKSTLHKDSEYVPAAMKEEMRRIALLLVDDEEPMCVEKKHPVDYRPPRSFDSWSDYPNTRHYGWSLEVTTASYRRSLEVEWA